MASLSEVLNDVHDPDNHLLNVSGGGGGSGSGDVVGPASSVDSELPLFSGTGGKTLKRSSATGIAKLTSGVVSTATAGTDYYNPGGTDVAVTDGGTGASNASGARTNLGLAIGSDVQGYDADLAAIAALSPTNDDVVQRKAGAWTNRTPTQLTADLIAVVGDSGAGGTKGLVPAPAAGDAAASKYLKADGTWATVSGGGGSGDVVGPASATDNAVVRYDATTGKLVQNSGVIIDDSNNVKIPGAIQDTNGNTVLSFGAGSTPANYVKIQNAPSAQEPIITTDGSASNITLLLRAKGTGSIVVRPNSYTTNSFMVQRPDGTIDLVVDTSNRRVGIATGTDTVHSTLQVKGALATAFSAKTANYTVTATDSKLSADCTSGNLTFTLPTAASVDGREYHFKRIDGSGNSVIVDGNASETIDGATTKTLGSQYAALTIYSNGSNWLIKNQMGTIS